jgi:hypothetical protein
MASAHYHQSVEIGREFQKKQKFKNWAGPDLYWWFRDTDHPINNWYSIALGGLAE